MDLIKHFRIIATLEGISYLALFAISMPLKYGLDILWPNQVIGMAHGVLFIWYCLLILPIKSKLNLKFTDAVIIFVASLLPFATFWIKKRYLSGNQD
jgi:integral membrane protein